MKTLFLTTSKQVGNPLFWGGGGPLQPLPDRTPQGVRSTLRCPHRSVDGFVSVVCFFLAEGFHTFSSWEMSPRPRPLLLNALNLFCACPFYKSAWWGVIWFGVEWLVVIPELFGF